MEKGKDLSVEYSIASFNPFRVVEPPELKFLVQKVLGEIRSLELRCSRPYTFFVLVVTDISDEKNSIDQWHTGYYDDLKKYNVCRDFSGEGYSRLAWSQETITAPEGATGAEGKSPSYRDAQGKHVNYHEITLKEFALKQIAWRVRKRFGVEYYSVPFDLTAQEKREAVMHIVKTVLLSYKLEEFEMIYLKDSSFLEEEQSFSGYMQSDIEKSHPRGVTRKPAF